MRTHVWKQIAKSKGVEDFGHMEKKLREMGRELSAFRDREAITIIHLETENEIPKEVAIRERVSTGIYGHHIHGGITM